MRIVPFAIVVLIVLAPIAMAADAPSSEVNEALEGRHDALRHQVDALSKSIDDLLWHHRVGDVAVVDKVRIYGPSRWKEANPDAIGAGNPVKFYSYVFTPKNFGDTSNLPLLILPHGGVHSDFTTYYAHIVRELMAQGYIVVAPEYRGSTGYGKSFYEMIDYGGREVGDCVAARDWAVENHPRVDPDRVGILGWSHGGLIALMSLFDHPQSFACAFAGVPVSDLVMRMGVWGPEYQAYYDADYHIGQTPEENLEEYKRRSPVWNVHKLSKPLRIHTNPHDEDVTFIEVEHLIQALKAEDKEFEYQIYDVPGGHSFDRLDTPEAWEARKAIYRFLAQHLKPPQPKVPLGISATGRAAP